jgi:hypothetical protein
MIMILPSNTTSLIQPLDQGLIAAFKTYYIRKTFERIHSQMEADPAAADLQPKTLNGCWKPIWPAVIQSLGPTVGPEIQQISKLAHTINYEDFMEINVSDIEELLTNDSEEEHLLYR